MINNNNEMDKSMNEVAFFLSRFIEERNLSEEFMAFIASKQSKVKLLDVEAMAIDSYSSDGFQGEYQELKEASVKANEIYYSLKAIIPLELQPQLYSLNCAHEDLGMVTAELGYKEGFVNAMKSITCKL